MNLTAEQIKWIDNINFDEKAIGHSLTVAMNYHSNRMSELEKQKKLFWKNISETFDLDLEKHKYRVNHTHNTVQIVKVEDEE